MRRREMVSVPFAYFISPTVSQSVTYNRCCTGITEILIHLHLLSEILESEMLPVHCVQREDILKCHRSCMEKMEGRKGVKRRE